MSDIKWAVVCVGYGDAIYSVDLFSDYEAAQEYMREAAERFLDETTYGVSLIDYGYEVIVIDGDGDVYYWKIEATNTH